MKLLKTIIKSRAFELAPQNVHPSKIRLAGIRGRDPRLTERERKRELYKERHIKIDN